MELTDELEAKLFQVHWFGASWGAAVCKPSYHLATPIGQLCMHCDRPIEQDDCGLIMMYHGTDGSWPCPSHIACFLDSITPCGRADCSLCVETGRVRN